jgi:phospholipid transport system substrate-binding protein
MKINTLAVRLGVLATFLALPGLAMAGPPTDVVQSTVVEMRSTVAVEDLGAELTREQVIKISRVLQNRFSFREMARLVLGQHWQPLSAQERTEFVQLFRGLLVRSFLLKMTTHPEVEQHYVGERIEGDRAVVQALVRTDMGELLVDYFLLPHNGSWKICDLTIDGVRLSHAYRADIHRVISLSSYKELVRQMSVKLEEVTMGASSQK